MNSRDVITVVVAETAGRNAEPITERGFVFMDTPGYDPVGATGQVVGGCNVMCFTAGRGSAFGCKPTPLMKLAANHYLYHDGRHGHQWPITPSSTSSGSRDRFRAGTMYAVPPAMHH